MFFGSVLKVISAEHSVLQEARNECFPRAVGRMHVPFDIKPEYLNPIIVLSLNGLLSGVELLPFVNVLAAGIAPPAYKLEIRTSRKVDK